MFAFGRFLLGRQEDRRKKAASRDTYPLLSRGPCFRRWSHFAQIDRFDQNHSLPLFFVVDPTLAKVYLCVCKCSLARSLSFSLSTRCL